MPPTARASPSTSLDGLVFALAGRRVSPTAQKAWTDFARAHGGAVILASQAKWEGPRVTHVVLVPSPRDLHHQPVYPQPPFRLAPGRVPRVVGEVQEGRHVLGHAVIGVPPRGSNPGR